jgi:cardiolipin synthase
VPLRLVGSEMCIRDRLYSFPLLLMAKIWTEAAPVLMPLAWAFALWGVGLYWWAGFVYLRQVRQVVKNSRQDSLG